MIFILFSTVSGQFNWRRTTPKRLDRIEHFYPWWVQWSNISNLKPNFSLWWMSRNSQASLTCSRLFFFFCRNVDLLTVLFKCRLSFIVLYSELGRFKSLSARCYLLLVYFVGNRHLSTVFILHARWLAEKLFESLNSWIIYTEYLSLSYVN